MDELEAEGKRRFDSFANHVVSLSEQSERAKVFAFPCGRSLKGENMAVSENRQSGSGSDHYDQLLRRDREISARLKKMKAMAFILESEQSSLRRQIGYGSG
jgi:hypothetical protein